MWKKKDSEMISYIMWFQMMFEGFLQNDVPKQTPREPFEDGRKSGKGKADMEMAPGLIR